MAEIDEAFANNLCLQLGGTGQAPNFAKMLNAATRLAKKRQIHVEPENLIVATKMQIMADQNNR